MKNVILITVDSFRSDHFNKEFMPLLTGLAEKNISSLNAYALGPWSPPAIKGIFTSTYPLMYNSTISIPNKATTIAEVFLKHRYKTAAFTLGGWLSPFFNFDKGFQIFDWGKDDKEKPRESSYLDKINQKLLKLLPKMKKFYRLFYIISHIKSGKIEDKILLEKTLNWIKNNKKDNFFSYLHLEGLHEPYFNGASTFNLIKANYNIMKQKKDLSEKKIENIKGIYKSAAIRTDKELFEFIQDIKKLNLLKNTYIVICGDHGQQMFEKDVFGHGSNLRNVVINIPLLIIGPDIKPMKITNPISLIDLAPTILDLVKMKKPKTFIGTNLLKSPREFIFIEAPKTQEQFPNMKDISYDIKNPQIALINKDYKYIYSNNDKNELYNIKEDPLELKNLLNSEKKISKRLREIIIKHLRFVKNEN